MGWSWDRCESDVLVIFMRVLVSPISLFFGMDGWITDSLGDLYDYYADGDNVICSFRDLMIAVTIALGMA